jgi:hypothetical protein
MASSMKAKVRDGWSSIMAKSFSCTARMWHAASDASRVLYKSSNRNFNSLRLTCKLIMYSWKMQEHCQCKTLSFYSRLLKEYLLFDDKWTLFLTKKNTFKQKNYDADAGSLFRLPIKRETWKIYFHFSFFRCSQLTSY